MQNPGWIHSASWGNILLPDVDEHTGHILVHFLCTGTYQTLHDIEISPEEEARVEFKLAFSAFVTANTYELAGLQHLAMHNTKQYGECMTILDIVGAIEFARQHNLQGIYNLVDDAHLKSRELLETLLTKHNLAQVIWDYSVKSNRPYNAKVSNQKIKDAGYQLIHPQMIF